MKIISKYKIIIAIVLPVLIMVLFRSFGFNHFKSELKIWAEPSVMRSNLITEARIGTLSGEKLIINLGKKGSEIDGIPGNALNIPADSLLSKNNINTIRKHVGPVLLYSSETAVSARIWMILSQMGYMNIYILTKDADNEVFNNEFRPDTTVRPEF